MVTGGGSGIGAEICRTFAREGARVAVLDIETAAATAVAQEIQREGGTAETWTADVADRAAVEAAATATEQRLGPIQVWVNSAGISRIVPFMECTDEIWDATLRVNLRGAFVCCQAAIRRMLPRNCGAGLNRSSPPRKHGNST